MNLDHMIDDMMTISEQFGSRLSNLETEEYLSLVLKRFNINHMLDGKDIIHDKDTIIENPHAITH